jgi:hypothetical protein
LKTSPIEQSIDPDVAVPPFHTPEALRGHPRFPEAATCLVDGLVSLYSYDRRLRSLIEYDRAVTFMLIVCLAAGEQSDRPETWLTMKRLNAFLPRLCVEPGRRINDLVTSLQDQDFLTTRRSPFDTRERILQPTGKMLIADREWLQIFHAPLALLYPDDDYHGAMRQDPTYQRAYRIASLTTLEIADRIVGGNPPADYFIRESVGTRLLMLLIQEVRDAPDRRTGPGFYTRAAALCGVSRTHARNVLQGAADRGWLRASDPPGLYIEVRDELWDSVERWVAEAVAGVDIVHGMALALLHTGQKTD